MRINYFELRDFKRFRNSKIKEFIVRFSSNITVITAANSMGKSACLYALCPLSMTKNEFGPNGYREHHIEHKGHLYTLINDFTVRDKNYSFQVDGKELNTNYTAMVQNELVEKHFGITPTIRDLIYTKIKLCSTTKSVRRDLFLNINPMKLGLILDTHKKAQNKIRDINAQLKHLYMRKNQLEHQMIAVEILEQHKATKERLTNEVSELEKYLYVLTQHVKSLQNQYKTDIEFATECVDNNRDMVPIDRIQNECKNIRKKIPLFADIPKGDAYTTKKNEISITINTLDMQKGAYQDAIINMSKEVDEYQKHLESTSNRPITKIESEIEELSKEINQYTDLPKVPIPIEQIKYYESKLNEISQLVFTFRDTDVKLLPIETINQQLEEVKKLKFNIDTLANEINNLQQHLERLEKEIGSQKLNAAIPEGCTFNTCGLRTLFTTRTEKLEKEYEQNKKKLDTLNKDKESLEKKHIELYKVIGPIVEQDLHIKYEQLYSLLGSGYFEELHLRDNLVDKLNTQPLLILKSLNEYIENSKKFNIVKDLVNRKNKLLTEVEVLNKQSGSNTEFITARLKEKEKEIEVKIKELDKIEKDLKTVNEQYKVLLDYEVTATQLRELVDIYQKGERALLVTKAIEYWIELGRSIYKLKQKISEELRDIETIVREQENFRNTYNSEIVKYVKELEKEKVVYEKIEQALSPTTGLPHKSMVKYLNAMINNVNYFIGQIWSFNFKLLPIDENRALDYIFKVDQNGEITDDITHLSDGQTEVMNLAWVLTILLQLKMLDQVPFFSDELARTFDPVHKMKALQFMGSLIEKKIINQLFITNHSSLFTDGFSDSDVISLDNSNINDIPKVVNEHVTIR